MNKQEAIAAMKEGKKLQHRYFSPHEWVTSDPLGILYTFEDGVKVSSRDFWSLRIADSFEEDWNFYEGADKYITTNY